jgi:protein-tyrosine phosphatase
MSVRVLFVCLGNICRSPMAEAVFQRLVDEAGLGGQFEIDSAGTGSWHIGERAHPGTRRVLDRHGITYHGRARQVEAADVAYPDTFIIAMDNENLRDLEARFGRHPRLYRLLDFSSSNGSRDVPDPYYSGGFEEVYDLMQKGARGLLEAIRKQEGI